MQSIDHYVASRLRHVLRLNQAYRRRGGLPCGRGGGGRSSAKEALEEGGRHVVDHVCEGHNGTKQSLSTTFPRFSVGAHTRNEIMPLDSLPITLFRFPRLSTPMLHAGPCRSLRVCQSARTLPVSVICSTRSTSAGPWRDRTLMSCKCLVLRTQFFAYCFNCHRIHSVITPCKPLQRLACSGAAVRWHYRMGIKASNP